MSAFCQCPIIVSTGPTCPIDSAQLRRRFRPARRNASEDAMRLGCRVNFSIWALPPIFRPKRASTGHPIAFGNSSTHGAAINVLRQVADSLESAASGISRYIAFCDLTCSGYAPPTSYRLRQWSALFRPVKTSGLYVPHVRRVRQILHISISQGDSLLRGSIDGLSRSQGKSDDFPNMADVKFAQEIIDFDGVASMFSIL